jgi:putative flippase GtrA
LVDFGLFNLFSQVFHINKYIANALSFTLAVFNNFYWNRLWTYPESKDSSFITKLGQFAIVSLIGLGINTSIFFLLDPSFIQFSKTTFTNTSISSIISANAIGDNLSKVVATIVVLFWNYFANRHWTFREIH